MEIFAFLKYNFIVRAFIAGSFIGILCSLLGIFLVLRRLSLIGDGLAHVTFGSIAVGIFFRAQPMYVALPLVAFSSLGILKLSETANIYGDAAIGIVSSLGIATGILLVSFSGGLNTDIFGYLFGSILSVSASETWISAVLSVAVIALICVLYQDLFSTTFDEEFARISGVKAVRINRVLVVVTGVTVVLAMKVVGIMLISSLLILPAAASLQVARSFKSALFISAAVSVFSVVTGIIVSFYADFPAGASIVMANFCLFIIAFFYKRVKCCLNHKNR